jgi:CcmD family protein
MPALPLHEAGKYVAAAYLVVFTLVLIYVAIMAMKLTRIEREVESINEMLDQRGR